MYSWASFAHQYLKVIDELFKQKNKETTRFINKTDYGKKLANADLFIISDLDGTLVEGNKSDGLKELKQWLGDNSESVVFGVASGRNKDITLQALAIMIFRSQIY